MTDNKLPAGDSYLSCPQCKDLVPSTTIRTYHRTELEMCQTCYGVQVVWEGVYQIENNAESVERFIEEWNKSKQ